MTRKKGTEFCSTRGKNFEERNIWLSVKVKISLNWHTLVTVILGKKCLGDLL